MSGADEIEAALDAAFAKVTGMSPLSLTEVAAKLRRERDARICALWRQGLSARAISRHVGITDDWVRVIAARNGLPKRGQYREG